MTYTLGLDLGSASIGWAMTTDSGITTLGSRLFPEGVEAKSREGVNKSREPKNRARRKKRLLRRQIARKALRREMLLHAFQLLGWLPKDSTELEKIWHEDPYALRKKGLDEALSKSELARAFFHLAKRRGFKSNRKAQSDEDLMLEDALETDSKDIDTKDTAEKSDNKTSNKKAKKNLLRDGDKEKQGYGEFERLWKSGEVRTIGEYLASLNPHEVRIRSRYVLRAHYEDEFDKLCDAQQVFHPELLQPVPKSLLTALCSRKQQTAWNKKQDQSLRAFIKSYLIFFQRPLKSQKHTVGKCSLEPNARRAPISSLAFQTYRIWTTLATIELLRPERRFLTLEEKQRAANILEKTKEIEIGKLLEKIGFEKTVVCNYAADKKIKGNETAVQMMTMFKATSGKPTKKEQEAIEAKWDALSEEKKNADGKLFTTLLTTIGSNNTAKKNGILPMRGQRRWSKFTSNQDMAI